MKKLVLSALVAAAVGVSAFQLATPGAALRKSTAPTALAETLQSYKVSTEESKITWIGRKVGGEHTGNIKLATGSMLFDRYALRGGTFIMDMTTITNTDLQGGSNERLVKHLRSDDFFSVEKNPTATFTISIVNPIAKAKAGQPNYTVTGNLTIKGITNPITFPATVKVNGDAAEALAKIEIDRTKWDIKYRSGLIGTAADKIIDDTFTLDVKLVAGKSSTAKL